MSARARALLSAVLVASMAALLLPLASAPADADDGTDVGPAGCEDRVVAVLARAGFEGEDLREAWAIVMRESRGIDVGPGHPQFNGRDYGIFQLNRPTWGGKTWWNSRRLMDADYSAAIAYRLSKGGSDWVLWGLDGDGRPRTHLYRTFGWTPRQIRAWVVKPYERFHRTFPCPALVQATSGTS